MNNFDSVHNDDVVSVDNTVRATSFIRINETSAAQRGQDWLIERIEREAAYQRKEAERAN
jgi:hypothetical protein